MELHVVENNAFSSIPNVQAVPSANSVRYFFAQFQMDMFLFLSFFVIFILAFLVFLLHRHKGDLGWEGLYLSAFCVLLSTWFLSGHGFFYAFSDNIGICAHIEFVACLTGANTRYAENMLRDFDQAITELNESQCFPFYVSVAYGMVRSTEQTVLSINEALKEADRRMYTAKIRMYAEDVALANRPSSKYSTEQKISAYRTW